ncbi:hypothetical protein LZ31DRAFT_553440 [Colletotrichum somersetense]|nr:hypothetical protein LZ31DRAFT_553440 [Colletotrichum somersetense]
METLEAQYLATSYDGFDRSPKRAGPGQETCRVSPSHRITGRCITAPCRWFPPRTLCADTIRRLLQLSNPNQAPSPPKHNSYCITDKRNPSRNETSSAAAGLDIIRRILHPVRHTTGYRNRLPNRAIPVFFRFPASTSSANAPLPTKPLT